MLSDVFQNKLRSIDAEVCACVCVCFLLDWPSYWHGDEPDGPEEVYRSKMTVQHVQCYWRRLANITNKPIQYLKVSHIYIKILFCIMSGRFQRWHRWVAPQLINVCVSVHEPVVLLLESFIMIQCVRLNCVQSTIWKCINSSWSHCGISCDFRVFSLNPTYFDIYCQWGPLFTYKYFSSILLLFYQVASYH